MIHRDTRKQGVCRGTLLGEDPFRPRMKALEVTAEFSKRADGCAGPSALLWIAAAMASIRTNPAT